MCQLLTWRNLPDDLQYDTVVMVVAVGCWWSMARPQAPWCCSGPRGRRVLTSPLAADGPHHVFVRTGQVACLPPKRRSWASGCQARLALSPGCPFDLMLTKWTLCAPASGSSPPTPGTHAHAQVTATHSPADPHPRLARKSAFLGAGSPCDLEPLRLSFLRRGLSHCVSAGSSEEGQARQVRENQTRRWGWRPTCA